MNVRSKRCSHVACAKVPHFNIEGSKTAAYCKQHAEDGMVNVLSKRCSHVSCTKIPNFSVKSSRTAAYCKQHAEDGMVNIRKRHCSHHDCFKKPAWGLLTDGTATTCTYHKGDILGGPVINFWTLCEVEGCSKVSRWGPNGKQPTHCRNHGALKDGFVCTVRTTQTTNSTRSPSNGVVGTTSFHVKTECLF